MKRNTNVPVVNVMLKRDGKILLLRRKNTGWMDGYYGVPSGHVEAGETFRQAACRETMEEVGIKLQPEQLEHRLTFHQNDARGDIRVGIYFEAVGWEGEPHNAEPHKHDDLAWFELNKLDDRVIPTTRAKLELINAGKQRYVEMGWEE